MSVGELRRIWRRGFIENQLCGCGQPFHDCPFWDEVVQRLDNGGTTTDAHAVDALGRGVYKGAQAAPRREAFPGQWGRLFRAIADGSGARWLVDSSKDPVYAAPLAGLPGFETRYLHLVRDARAVAYSKMRRRLHPEIHRAEAYMARRSAWASAWQKLPVGPSTSPGSACATRILRLIHEARWGPW